MIRNLRIQRFLSHKDTLIPFDKPVTVIAGPNGAGKSAIVDAVETLLSGRARGFDQKEMSALARGERGWKIEADLVPGAPTSENGYDGGKFRISRTTSTCSPKQGEIDSALAGFGIDRKAVVASLRVSRWLGMAPAERRQLVWDAVRTDTKALAAKLEAEGRPADAAKWKAFLEVLASDNFKEAMRAASEYRKEYAAVARADLPVVFDPTVETGRGPRKTSELPDHASMVSALAKARTDVRTALEALKTPAGALAAKYEADLAALRESAAKAKVRSEAAAKAWDGVEAEARKIDADAKIYEREVEELRLAFAREEAVKALLGGDKEVDVCPCCLRKVDDDERVALAGRFEKARKESDGVRASGAVKARVLAELRAKRAGMEKHYADWEREAKAYEDAKKEIERLEAALADARAREAEAPKADVDALQKRERTGQLLCDARLKYESEWALRAAAEASAAAASGEAAKWARIEEAMREPADADKMAEALAAARAALRKASPMLFAGDESAVALSDAWEPAILGRDERAASKSERTRASIALAYALATVAGSPLLIVDDAEEMEEDTRNAATKFLLEAAPEFGRIVMLAAVRAKSREKMKAPPDGAPLDLWWVANGEAERVVAAEERSS